MWDEKEHELHEQKRRQKILMVCPGDCGMNTAGLCNYQHEGMTKSRMHGWDWLTTEPLSPLTLFFQASTSWWTQYLQVQGSACLARLHEPLGESSFRSLVDATSMPPPRAYHTRNRHKTFAAHKRGGQTVLAASLLICFLSEKMGECPVTGRGSMAPGRAQNLEAFGHCLTASVRARK